MQLIKRTYNSLMMNSRLKVRRLASRLTAPKHLGKDREGERGRTREKGNEQGPWASISLTGTGREGKRRQEAQRHLQKKTLQHDREKRERGGQRETWELIERQDLYL
jgi:hypothetical protein